MKFTFAWLKQFLQTSSTPQAVAAALNTIGHEVEEIQDYAKTYAQFIIAEIISTEKHPSADKLAVCKVNDGKKELQIVCGAPNARAGIKVVLAPVGALIPNGNFTIKASSIRGVESCGMLCSAAELILSDDHDGIIELAADAKVGDHFAEYAGLNDVVFDISLTPNRGDCASVYGIARDLAAYDIGNLIQLQPTELNFGYEAGSNVDISAKSSCSEFLGIFIKSVKINPILTEIDSRLRLIGSSKKLSLVDISNYLMYSYGRPNHIYDADKIEGNITIRFACENEPFIAIGGKEYELSPEIMVVADDHKVLSVAGVIGGELSKVTEDTKNIFFESAVFAPEAVTTSGRIMNLHTDARFRFERRVDSAISNVFFELAVNMIQNYCGGQCSIPIAQYGNEVKAVSEIEFDHEKVNQLLGSNLTSETCYATLGKLGFKQNGSKVVVPSWRYNDVSIKEDLIEEIIRIHGYDHIPSTPLPQVINFFKQKQFDHSKILNLRGMDETISWSFYSYNDAATFGDSGFIIKNPISSELAIMRQSILPNLIRFAINQQNHGQKNVCLFELGPIYKKEYNHYQQNCLSGIRSGEFCSLSPHKETRIYDFFDIKADLFSIIEANGINVNNLIITQGSPNYYHPAQSAAFYLGKSLIGYCGRLHPQVVRNMGSEENFYAFELFIETLPNSKSRYKAKSRAEELQPVNRDFAFIMDDEVKAGELLNSIRKLNKHISVVNVFDIYKGKGIEEGKKSVAISIKLQPIEITFTEEEIDKISNEVIINIQSKFNGVLRK